MLLTLLLQAAPTASQGTPITVYVTLFAAVLAALASLNATRISSKTSREAAILSAQTAKESASLAAQTARELKDKDYKNDFYKKLIEKRLNAWSEAESFGKHLFSIIRDEKDGKPGYSYLAKPEKFWQVFESINNSIIGQMIWIQGDYNGCILEFRQKLVDIANGCTIRGTTTKDLYNELDEDKLWLAAKEQHQELSTLHIKMMNALGKQLPNLHDIESFLGSSSIGANSTPATLPTPPTAV